MQLSIITVWLLAISNGITTIRIVQGAISNETTLTVTNLPTLLTNISIHPQNPSVLTNFSVQFFATGQYNNGETSNITDQTTWFSTNSNIAIIDNNGLAFGISNGVSAIRAIQGLISNETTLTVTNLLTVNNGTILTNISINPINPSVLTNLNLQFFATGQYDDGTMSNLTTQVTWLSLNTTVATINISNGLATALMNGITTIRAILGMVSNETILTVTNAPTNGGGGVLTYNSGDFTADGIPDVLVFKRGNNGLKLLDVTSNFTTESVIGPIITPKKWKFLAGNRLGLTNYLVFKTGKQIIISSYQVNNTFNKLADTSPFSIPKNFDKIKASGDLNGDSILDLIGIKKKNTQVLYGPNYTTSANINGLTTGNQIPGKIGSVLICPKI